MKKHALIKIHLMLLLLEIKYQKVKFKINKRYKINKYLNLAVIPQIVKRIKKLFEHNYN